MLQKIINFILFALLSAHGSVMAQNLQREDHEAIKKMCGCFEVEFLFAETFVHVDDSSYRPSERKIDYALEWVELVEQEEDKLILQHLLIVGPQDNEHIIKHWRQDWLYENTDLFVYDQDNRWEYTSVPDFKARGTWTQKVYQVDDSPRYEGLGTWVHLDGVSYWESTADAPLPRREYTKRSDYNVTRRTNRHEITPKGWVHDQDNIKIKRTEGQEDVILAEEKGRNTYKRVDNSRCLAAQSWWQDNKDKWALIRREWSELFHRHEDLTLQPSIDNVFLFDRLFALPLDAKQTDVKKIIAEHMQRE